MKLDSNWKMFAASVRLGKAQRKNGTKVISAKKASVSNPSFALRIAIKHNANRELPTQTVLALLKRELPSQYELAEIVGKWVWLDFPQATHRAAANTLYRLGFHWNQRRCVWQHLCGVFAPYAP